MKSQTFDKILHLNAEAERRTALFKSFPLEHDVIHAKKKKSKGNTLDVGREYTMFEVNDDFTEARLVYLNHSYKDNGKNPCQLTPSWRRRLADIVKQ